MKIGYEDEIFDYIDDLTKSTYLPVPIYGNGVGQFSLFKQVKKMNLGIILTGHGGDNIFCGYNYTLNALMIILQKETTHKHFIKLFFQICFT